MKKQIIRIIAIAIISIMVIAVLPIASSATSLSTWDGSASTSFGGGDGLKDTPYLITTANELAYLASSCNAGETYAQKYFKLTTDVDISSNPWIAIGLDATHPFSGIFDGDGHTIAGLNIENQADYAGLFGRCDSAVIMNFNVTGTIVKSLKYSGAFVGYGTNSTELINLTSDVDLVSGLAVGGIVGRTASGDISSIIGCFSSSTVVGNALGSCFAGGIVGAAGNTKISYCGNTGDVSIEQLLSDYHLAGGIVGCQGASSASTDVDNCFNSGNIITTPSSSVYFAGGISGRASHVDFGSVKNCFSIGTASVVWGDATEQPEGHFGGLYGNVLKLVTFENNYTSFSPVVGTDMASGPQATNDNSKLITTAEITGINAVATMGLNANMWYSVAGEIPEINFEAVYAAYLESLIPVETTVVEEETTAVPDDTTVPTTTVNDTTVASTTIVAGTTNAVTTESIEDEGCSCGGSGIIVAAIQFIAIIGGAVTFVIIKKK